MWCEKHGFAIGAKMVTNSVKPGIRPAARQDYASDEELLVRYRDSGDSAAFETLVHRFETPVRSFLTRYLRNASLAEDVYQATMFRVHEKCKLFAESRKLRPWIYKIATNQAIDTLRRESRHQAASLDDMRWVDDANLGRLLDLLQSSAPTPLEHASDHERAEWTRRAVNVLPDHQRIVMLLIFFHGLKYREVAEVLHLREGTVKSRVHKALLALRQAWRRDHCDE